MNYVTNSGLLNFLFYIHELLNYPEDDLKVGEMMLVDL